MTPVKIILSYERELNIVSVDFGKYEIEVADESRNHFSYDVYLFLRKIMFGDWTTNYFDNTSEASHIEWIKYCLSRFK